MRLVDSANTDETNSRAAVRRTDWELYLVVTVKEIMHTRGRRN